MEHHSLCAAQVSAGYGQKTIVHDVALEIPAHKISVIIGANGCGKSTLLKTFARLLSPTQGAITLDGKEIATVPSRQLAQTMGLLPQTSFVPEGIRVTELVSRGRYPYRGFWGNLSKADFAAVEEALDLVGMTAMADREVDELSGGQKQRVWLALALAQQTDILLLDEPTTYLDISYQVEILDLLADLNARRGTTVVMVLHDINLAARYADYLYAMRDGRLVASGSPREVVSEELIRKIFGLECVVINDPVAHTPFVVPKGRHHIANSSSAL